MAVNQWGKGVPEITQAEHISPDKTGDNIEAKKAANYVFNPDTNLWERQLTGFATSAKQDITNGLITATYDNVVQTQNTNQDIWTFKTGATTNFTITITYTDTTKTVISTVVRT